MHSVMTIYILIYYFCLDHYVLVLEIFEAFSGIGVKVRGCANNTNHIFILIEGCDQLMTHMQHEIEFKIAIRANDHN